METPLLNHITKQEFDCVYEPAEDSFLMIDALEADLDFIENELNPSYCLEIGSGSGIISSALAKRLNYCFCITTDINCFACRITKRTGTHNKVKLLEAINTNLASGIRFNLFDIIVFNPPYVVTEENECQNDNRNLLAYTWAGGANGRTVIDKFIKKLETMLAPSGVAYLLLLKENKPDDVILMLQKIKFTAIIFMERRIRGEHLFILKIFRKS